MSCNDVIELSSDNELSLENMPRSSNFDMESFGGNIETFVEMPDDGWSAPCDRSKSDDDSSVSGSPVIGSQYLHDLSSSDDYTASTQVDRDCVIPFNLSSDSSEAKAGVSSQSFVSSQSSIASKKDKESGSSGRADKALIRKEERERNRMRREALNKEKRRVKEEKKRLKEEQRRIERERLADKRQFTFERNQIRPNECVKYMNIVVEEKLSSTRLFSQVREIFPNPDVNFLNKDHPLEYSICWTRKQLCGSCCDEEWVAVMWTGEDVVKAIMDSTLVSQFKNITSSVYPDKRILLLIFAMDLYHRKFDNSNNFKKRMMTEGSQVVEPQPKYLSRAEIERGLVELQILAGVSHRHFSDVAQLADILWQLTRAIAEIPYRREKEKADKEMGWYARSFGKNCVRANKEMQGLDKLWLHHLTVFFASNLDTAKAIVSLYPTPAALIEAYENCDNDTQKELLLQNIQVKRSGSYRAPVRRVGPELSKKIYLTFTRTDGGIKLSSKK